MSYPDTVLMSYCDSHVLEKDNWLGQSCAECLRNTLSEVQDDVKNLRGKLAAQAQEIKTLREERDAIKAWYDDLKIKADRIETRLVKKEVDKKKDSEAWLISTCTTVHEREHAEFLSACTHPICRALSALASEIEAMEERP